MKSLYFSLFILMVVFFLNIFVGIALVSYTDFYNFIFSSSDNSYGDVIIKMRLQRFFVALCVGGFLALSGGILQRLLLNPLADPFILGITSGGSLGALLTRVFENSFALFVPFISMNFFGAFSGCLLAFFLLLLFRKGLKHYSDIYVIPVIGIILNSFFSSLIMFTTSLADPHKTGEAMRWMLGSLYVDNFSLFLWMLFPALLILFYVFYNSPHLYALALGDMVAKNLGFSPESLRKKYFILVAFMIAFSVSFTGSLGFIGLIVPHIARKLSKGRIRYEFILCFVLGGALLALADWLGRILTSSMELPAGIFTALLGSPALAIILLQRAKKGCGHVF